MKKQLSITFLMIVSLVAVLLNLSCGGTSPNIAVKTNSANGNAMTINTDQKTEASADKLCSSGNPSGKPDRIIREIEDSIKGDTKLDYQYKKRFDFAPVMKPNSEEATLYIWGSIFIQDMNNDLDNLHKKYKPMLKKGCVTNVVYSAPPGTTTLLRQNFEYTLSCEAPNRICDDGTCQEDCVKVTGNTNNNTISNK